MSIKTRISVKAFDVWGDQPLAQSRTLLVMLILVLSLTSLQTRQAEAVSLVGQSKIGFYEVTAANDTISLNSNSTTHELNIRIAQVTEIAPNGTTLQKFDMTPASLWLDKVYYNITRLLQSSNRTSTITMDALRQSPGVFADIEVTQGQAEAKITFFIGNLHFVDTSSKVGLKLEFSSDGTVSFDGNGTLSSEMSPSNTRFVFSWNNTSWIDTGPSGADCSTSPTQCGPVSATVRDGDPTKGDSPGTQKVVEFQFSHFQSAIWFDPTMGIAAQSGNGSQHCLPYVGIICWPPNLTTIGASSALFLLILGGLFLRRKRKRATSLPSV